MKFQVTQSFSVTIKGRRTEYKVGQRIGEAAYRRLTKTQQGRFLPARRCGAQSWTDAEYQAMANAYVNNAGDRKAIIAEFRQTSARHTDAALDIAAQACRELDLYVVESTGLKDHADGLLIALQDIDNDRFACVAKEEKAEAALDALLADIRA